MQDLLEDILTGIAKFDSKHASKLRMHLPKSDSQFKERASGFLERYRRHLESDGRSLSFGIDAYETLIRSMLRERLLFLRSGHYSNQSFDDVNRRVYGNPEIMEQHMHGLVLAQFLWPDQYKRFAFFCDHFQKYVQGIGRYLEIGGGHALYASHAEATLAIDRVIDLVDISPSSITLAKGLCRNTRIRFHCTDARNLSTDHHYDFVTMGEVLEHLENPYDLLQHVRRLLAPSGTAFITTPANAPMIDHIWLFRDEIEIRDLLNRAGLKIEQECIAFSDNVSEDEGRRQRLPMMYAAFVQHA